MLHSVRKSLTDLGDKVDASEKENIEKAADELEEALKGDDKDAITAKTEALATASHKLAEQAYASAEGAQADAGNASHEGQSKSGDDDVVDAEFEEVKDDDKK
jgi:molecular chaperone DnaK